MAISRDPKLKRHDDGRELSNRNWKNLGYKPRPKFLAFQEIFAEFSTDECAPLRKHVDMVIIIFGLAGCKIEDITWPLGDTNFVCSCWKCHSRVSDEMSRSKQLVLLIFEIMKKWSLTAKRRMLCNMKQDLKVIKKQIMIV